jgi:RNA polymerase sigma-70 factor (ECF subfamily)
MAESVDDIIARVLSGETDAYAEIVRRYQNEAWKTAAAALHDVQTTESLVQQAFVNAYLHLDRFRPGGDFAVWIKAVTRNVVRQELRRRARQDRRLDGYREHLLARLSDDTAAERRGRDYEAALADCRRSLAESVDRALDMRYAEGWDFERIAGELGRTVSATRQLLNRVRATLRECIEKKLARA